MDPSLRRGFRIGVYHVEPLAGRITGPDGSQHVQPKVMDVLVFLAQHAGELVERDTLLEQIWRRVTSEEVLTRCISELRRALGDERGSPAYIQTVPKRGYRLVEPVVLIADPAATSVPPAHAPAEQAPVAATPPRPASAIASVAVLPFDTHSPDPALVYIGDAFAAELQNTLTRVDRLRVAARRSSFALKQANADIREIGERLNVDYVISGSIQSNGPNLRVFAELNETIGGTQVWAQSYDRSSADLLAVEKDVAGAIVASFTTQTLRAEIHTARQKTTNNLDAWGLVQKARSLALDYTAAGLAEAIRPLERAIELDPEYAAAHATLGSLLIEWLVNGLSTNAEHDEKVARDSAEKALDLAPQDPFILKMVSLVYTYAGDHAKAIACLRKAVVYAPFDFGAWGYMVAARGDRRPEGFAGSARDPRPPVDDGASASGRAVLALSQVGGRLVRRQLRSGGAVGAERGRASAESRARLDALCERARPAGLERRRAPGRRALQQGQSRADTEALRGVDQEDRRQRPGREAPARRAQERRGSAALRAARHRRNLRSPGRAGGTVTGGRWRAPSDDRAPPEGQSSASTRATTIAKVRTSCTTHSSTNGRGRGC